MASSKDYLSYILEQLKPLEGITHRSMMGEYIVYCQGKIIAYICDDRFLVKPVETALAMLSNAPLEPPYDGAKPMVLVENTDDSEFLCDLILKILPELPNPKPKKKKKE